VKPAPPSVAQDKVLLADKQQSPAVRAAAAGRLRMAQINDAGVDALPDLLKAVKSEPDHDTRVAIINAAIGIVLHYKWACPTEFVDLLFDPDPDIRWLASNYVGWAGGRNMYGPPSAQTLPLLIKASHHEDVRVRNGAVQALGNIGVESEKVLPELTKALQDGAFSVRNNATVAIWHVTGRADLVIPALAAMAGSDGPLNDRDEETVRNLFKMSAGQRIEGLVQAKPDDVCKELIRALRSPSADVRRGSVRFLIALSNGKDPKLAATRKVAREEVAGLATDPDEQVRAAVKDILQSVPRSEPLPDQTHTQGDAVPR
jgi:HEAT repeat protein